MQALDCDASCPECSKMLIDTGDELVCPACGIAKEKQVVEPPAGGKSRPLDAVRLPLGSYMGERSPSAGRRTAGWVDGAGARYKYLKAVSDFAGRDEGSAEACARLIERVGEKLGLPAVVLTEAASMAGKVLSEARPPGRMVVATVSAHSLISACRVEGVPTVSPREVIAAHAALGRRVSSSSVIQLSLDSPIKTYAQGAKDYLARVLAGLSADGGLGTKLPSEGVQTAAYVNLLRRTAIELLELADRIEMSGKRPCALAAAAVYSAEMVLSICEGRKRRLTQRQVALCGSTSEYTVRDQCNEIFAPAVRKLVSRKTSIPTVPPGR